MKLSAASGIESGVMNELSLNRTGESEQNIPVAPWSTQILSALRSHWPEYLLEGLELGLFMISACVFVVLLEYPGSSVHQALPHPPCVASGTPTPVAFKPSISKTPTDTH
jgi:hypothetical protein